MMGQASDFAGPLATMTLVLSQILPLIYGFCFLILLWQAFRVMSQGFAAASGRSSSTHTAGRSAASTDRTGKTTIHPELLDANGQLTQEELLTVRFSGGSSQSNGDESG